MKFYELDDDLKNAVSSGDAPVRVKVEIDYGGHFESVFEDDIVEADFYGIKEAAGGISARGELLLENAHGAYSIDNAVGREVRVYFSVGEGLPFYKRFTFFIDGKGIQDIRGAGRRRIAKITLQDYSYNLRKVNGVRDWTAPVVFTYSVVCDGQQHEKSLLHRIAVRAGISGDEIKCGTIKATLPFVRLRHNVWAELSSLAAAYRCHLECTPDKKILFAHSPYQEEPLLDDEYSHVFKGEDIFYLRKTEREDLYRNTVRLKVNMPVGMEKQEIWRYEQPPVFYDEAMRAYYPFRSGLVREIEAGRYEAAYRITGEGGKVRDVIFADEIDTQAEAEKRLEYEGGGFAYTHYDTVSNFNKAYVRLQKEADGDLYRAAIYGRPIVLDLNRSSFMRDSEAVRRYGTVALNVTGAYFSDYYVGGRPHYEDWVKRELAERVKNRRELTVKTHRGLFHVRVGAKVQVKINREQVTGVINAFSLRYRRESAFTMTFRIIEQ